MDNVQEVRHFNKPSDFECYTVSYFNNERDEISGSHVGEYEDESLLEHSAV
jgi:hypothetical protein